MSGGQFFWKTMERCDWSKEGGDDQVLEPVVRYLAQQEDSRIFQFDDLMSELLYGLDTKKLADQCEKAEPNMSDDSFLYSRCAALINGPGYYEQARLGQRNEMWTMEFEALLYVPAKAWALKHGTSEAQYPHIAPVSYETGSNQKQWT